MTLEKKRATKEQISAKKIRKQIEYQNFKNFAPLWERYINVDELACDLIPGLVRK